MSLSSEDFIERTYYMREWLRGGGVATAKLVEELELWLAHFREGSDA